MKPPPSGLPDHEARRLLQLALGADATGMARRTGLTPDEVAVYQGLVERRRGGEPLQYIEGTVQFGPLELLCDSRALIPRPETEYLWEVAVAAAKPVPDVVVDLGTGSGNLALALKHAFPAATVYATDVSPDALALARENMAYTGLDVVLCQGDLFDALSPELAGKVDLLVSNPPYVAVGEQLPAEIVDYEPAPALFAGRAGTEVLERIAGGINRWLSQRGQFFIEIGERQTQAALEIFDGFPCRVVDDLAGRPRILVGALTQGQGLRSTARQ